MHIPLEKNSRKKLVFKNKNIGKTAEKHSISLFILCKRLFYEVF